MQQGMRGVREGVGSLGMWLVSDGGMDASNGNGSLSLELRRVKLGKSVSREDSKVE